MTQASFDNYVEILDYRMAKLAASVSIRLHIGAGDTILDYFNLSLVRKYTDLLHKYTLVAESPINDYPENYLTPTEMKSISEWAHKVLGMSHYNIDFILTLSDVYPPIPAMTFTGTVKYISKTINNTILQ